MASFLGSLVAIALQSVVTFYYFNYFGVTWQSVIPFFIAVQYIKYFLTDINKNK